VSDAPAPASASADLLSVGRVGRPHGLDGSFHVTEPRPRLLGLGSVMIAGDAHEVVRHAGTDARPILRLAGVDDREGVEALRGVELWVPRALAPPLEPDEWYAEDLEGCRVVDGELDVGVVRRMLPYPSCELLEVARDGTEPARPDLLIPLISDAVRKVDVPGRCIDVDLAFLGEGA
jgi:16S rRNA processing protein RimM